MWIVNIFFAGSILFSILNYYQLSINCVVQFKHLSPNKLDSVVNEIVKSKLKVIGGIVLIQAKGKNNNLLLTLSKQYKHVPTAVVNIKPKSVDRNQKRW